MRAVYEAGRQIWRARLAMLIVAAFSTWGVLWGIDMTPTYGLQPAAGGVLKPPHVRRTMPVRGYRVPFLLDAQGAVRDHRAVGSLLRLRGADVERLRAQSSTAMTSAASRKRKRR